MHEYFLALDSLINILDKHWNDIDIDLFGLWIDKGWEKPTDCFEIFYIISGSNILTIDNINYSAREGDIFFTDYNVSNYCNKGTFRMYYITFSTKCVIVNEEIKNCFNKLIGYKDRVNIHGLEEDFKNLCMELSFRKQFNKISAKHYLINIIIKLSRIVYRNSSQYGSALNSKYEKVIDGIMAYINENINKKICLSDLRKIYNMDERHMNRIFKKSTGYTIGKFITSVRIEFAKRLLSATNVGITEVALELGFCDCAHFCNIFKEHVGITPLNYRESIGNKTNENL